MRVSLLHIILNNAHVLTQDKTAQESTKVHVSTHGVRQTMHLPPQIGIVTGRRRLPSFYIHLGWEFCVHKRAVGLVNTMAFCSLWNTRQTTNPISCANWRRVLLNCIPRRAHPTKTLKNLAIMPPFKVTALRSATRTTACSFGRTQPMPAVNARTIKQCAR